MNKLLPFIVAFTLFFKVIGTAQTGSVESDNSKLLFLLEFEQDGRVIKAKDKTITLAKKEFKLRLTMDAGQQAFVNFSQSPELYDAVKSSKRFTDILGFGGTGMAEYSKNPEREIILCNDAWHVWPATNDKFNRFDKMTINNGKVIGERTVENVRRSSDNSNVLFQELSVIYMVYCYIEDLGDFNYKPVEVEAVKIIFE